MPPQDAPSAVKSRTPKRMALALSCYWLLVVIFGVAQRFHALPAWLEAPFSALVFPGVAFLGACAPWLRPLGLASGEMFAMPTPGACLALMALSTATCWALAAWLCGRHAKK